jgi:hypothetical protein
MTPSIPRSTFAFFGHAFMTTGKVYLILFLIVGWVVGGLTEIDGIWAPVWIAGTFLAVLLTAFRGMLLVVEEQSMRPLNSYSRISITSITGRSPAVRVWPLISEQENSRLKALIIANG